MIDHDYENEQPLASRMPANDGCGLLTFAGVFIVCAGVYLILIMLWS